MPKRVIPSALSLGRKFFTLVTLSLGVVVGLFQWAIPSVSGAGTSHIVYVSSPSDAKILKVVATVNGGSVSSSVSLVFPTKKAPSGFAPKAMTFGPDGKLWVVSGNQILKVDPNNGSSSTCYSFPTGAGDPSTPGDVRFLANVPYFTATGTGGSSGVWRFSNLNCASPQKVASTSFTTPAGIVLSLTGRLLYLDGAGQLFRSAPPFNSPSTVFSGLSAPVAVGAGGSHGFPDTTTTYVTAAGNVKVLSCGDSSPCSDAPADISFSSDAVRDLEVNLGGKLLVASLTPGSQPIPKLWLVEGTTKRLLVDFSTVKGKASIGNIWGIAIPPTSYAPSGVLMGSQTRFNCGNSLVDVTLAGPGTPTVDCQLALPGAVNSLFNGDAAGASCASYDWNNGFCTIMDVGPDNVDKTVFVTYVRKAEPLAANPLIVRNFNEVSIVDYYLLGPLDPTDQGRKSGRASDLVVADRAINDPAGFDRYRPDLGSSPGTASRITGGTLPIRIDFDEPCDDGNTLRLTVVCNANDPSALDTSITPVSNGNTNFENFFRCGDGSGWYYNLDLDASHVPTGGNICAVSGWGDVGVATPLGFFYRP
jgi:hypothetical protein